MLDQANARRARSRAAHDSRNHKAQMFFTTVDGARLKHESKRVEEIDEIRYVMS